MSDDLTFSVARMSAFFVDHDDGSQSRYDVDVIDAKAARRRYVAWFMPFDGEAEVITPTLAEADDVSAFSWPSFADACDACRKHYKFRHAVSMAPAGPVSVDADGAPV